MKPTPSREARLRAGFTARQAGRKSGLTARALLRRERNQDFPLTLALLLTRLYGCDWKAFLPTTRTPGSRAGSPGAKPRPAGKRQAPPAAPGQASPPLVEVD
jgi:transcriptional regulator with XRE-family HTH domain